jgi:acetyl esterase/lipase
MGVPAFAQTEIPLYPGPLPNSKPCSTIETANANGVLSGVTQPKLYVYLPEQKDSLQTAVLICPGGGYANVAIQHEGFQVAKALAKKGITAFVLKYRTPKDSACCTNTETLALQDAQQAIQVIRTNATTYGINPNKLGILGFSAGGHLAATVTTHFNTAVIENPQQTSLRPDFAVLIYPVISFQDSLTHMGSRNNMLGKNPTQAKKDWYSNELQVTDQTPPCFLLHAADDKTVKVANSMLFYNALLQHKVPAEMHLYQKGGHGFGLNNKAVTTPWLPMVLDWLKANALMKGNVQ